MFSFVRSFDMLLDNKLFSYTNTHSLVNKYTHSLSYVIRLL